VNILSFENRLRKRCDEPLKMRERITTESSVIRLHEVSLVLGQGKNPVLNKISLDLKEGESLGVIGPSGCGKSSLISVMLGIHLPTSGTMYIAPQLIADSVHEYRRKFAVIPQTPLLVSGSLRSNLCDGNSVADEELVDILNQLGVHRLFGERVNAKMLDHMIDGLNPKMSTGDAQMIMATRAFLKKDAVVIMDEPTSMMDPKRERNFHHVIDRVLKDRTQLRVAHRLETIRNCDRLVYMEHGSVVMIDSVERVLSAFSMRT
jgi:ABC-type bacteriocin/lantibiotic exporter with double-glycine peptidase domain